MLALLPLAHLIVLSIIIHHKGLLSRPLAPRLSNWFQTSLSSRYTRTTSSMYQPLSKKPGGPNERWCLF
jgi:hypothetical protein